MKRTKVLTCALTCCAAAAWLPTAASAASLEVLGFPAGHFSTWGHDVSADGSTVVGTSVSEAGTSVSAFRWTRGGGFQLLPNPPGTIAGSGRAVSADGSVTTGHGDKSVGFRRAALWREDQTAHDLGVLPGGTTNSFGYDVSGDGATVVGQSALYHGDVYGIDGHAYRWTATAGLEALGKLPGLDDSSSATGVSADGSTVVGWSRQTSPWRQEAFVWTAEAGMQGLGHLPDHPTSAATAISSDGSTVVGISAIEPRFHPYSGFVWTADEGMLSLGTLPGFNHIDPSAVSADGSVVVGTLRLRDAEDEGDVLEPFIWTRQHGLMSLFDVLRFQGVDLADFDFGDYRLGPATGISADGRTISGWADIGYRPTEPWGRRVAWLAEISLDFPLPGDTNADGRVDMEDLNNVRNGFAGAGPDDGTLPGDAFPFDGLVDIDDLNAVRNNFGTGMAAVPEPSAGTLAILLALPAMLVRNRSRRRSAHSKAAAF